MGRILAQLHLAIDEPVAVVGAEDPHSCKNGVHKHSPHMSIWQRADLAGSGSSMTVSHGISLGPHLHNALNDRRDATQQMLHQKVLVVRSLPMHTSQ